MKTWNLIMAAAILAAGLCAGQARGATIESAGSGLWTNGATWVGSVAPGINDEAVITNGCTVTMNDMVMRSVSNLTIQAGGVLTHTPHGIGDTTEKYKVILNIVSNLTINAGGTINANGKGFAANQGPGVPTGNGGCGHGGVGISAWGPEVGTTYGSITAPTNLGSGGSDGGAAGGGAVILTVGGATTVDGGVLAQAANVPNWQSSGGSIFLTTASLAGGGTMSVRGWGGVGSGGGGRIAVKLNGSTDFGSVKMQAYGGANGASSAGAGTLYLEHTGHASDRGILIVDNNGVELSIGGVTLQNGKAESSSAFSEIILTNSGVYALDTNDTLNIAGTIVRGSPADRKDGILLRGGTLTGYPPAFSFTNYYIGIGHTNTTFGPTSLTVASNATLRIDVPWTMNHPLTPAPGGYLTFNAPVFLNSSLTIPSGAVLEHLANSGSESYKLNLTVNGDLDIQAGSEINLDKKGYQAGNRGPGAPAGNGGAGYGGMGGGSPGMTYGSITAPTNMGSSASEGSGGGVAILRVAGATTLNGSIKASADLSGNWQSAAGTVFLTTAILSGNGTIRANAGTSGFGAGGGGRIAVVLTNGNDFGSILMEAYGGGSPGTIYKQTKDQGPDNGTLLINAGNYTLPAASYTMICDKVIDTTVGTVIITNSAKLAVSNQTLTVRGDWVNRVTFLAMTNSTVNFSGTNLATIYTNNTFFNFTCTNAGKTLVFEAGRTNAVIGLLKLGASQPGQMVTLQSTTNGSWSYLTLTPGGTQTIARVNVKDNNAGGGQTLLVSVGSANGGNNINWQFPPSGTMFMVK